VYRLHSASPAAKTDDITRASFSYNPANNKWSTVTLQAKRKKTGGGGAKAKRSAREAKALEAVQSGGDGQDVDMDAPAATPTAGEEEGESDEDSETEEKVSLSRFDCLHPTSCLKKSLFPSLSARAVWMSNRRTRAGKAMPWFRHWFDTTP
jgi:hypothetical protein